MFVDKIDKLIKTGP